MAIYTTFDNMETGLELGYKFEREFDMQVSAYPEEGTKTIKQYVFSYAHGKVIRCYENNQYHDSYFYAIVFDGENESHIQYASTAYGCQGCHAESDASNELLNDFKKFKKKQDEENNLLQIELLMQDGIPAYLCKRFHEKLKGFQIRDKERFLNLLKTKKFRSEFRKSLFNQVKNWLLDDNPQYNSPLSPRQMNYL